jgi:acetyl-CoA carboxylase biotin carboxyl carrier protein
VTTVTSDSIMTTEEIKEIIQLMLDSGVAELEVQRGDNRVWVKRGGVTLNQEVTLSAVSAATSAAASPAAAAAPSAAQAADDTTDPSLVTVKSPIVGTYYEAPSPGSAPFVKAGDTIQPGQVLCIIESMKLMNEIEAEMTGVVVSRLVENGRPVEYGEALFLVRPL